MNNAKIGTALVGGYLLGRTKKAKLALGLGAMLAGSRIRPDQLGRTLQQSPVLKDVTKQVRSELAGASKAAATSVMTAKANSLADALHQRTAGLREQAHRTAGRDEEGDEDETAAAEETEEAEKADEEPEEEHEEPEEEHEEPEEEHEEPEEEHEAEEKGRDEVEPSADEAEDEESTEGEGTRGKGGGSSGGRKSAARRRTSSSKSGAASEKSGSAGKKATKKTSAAAPSRPRGGGSRSGRSDDG
jgi:hypothetical protein